MTGAATAQPNKPTSISIELKLSYFLVKFDWHFYNHTDTQVSRWIFSTIFLKSAKIKFEQQKKHENKKQRIIHTTNEWVDGEFLGNMN